MREIWEIVITYLDYITIVFAFCAMIAAGCNFFARKKDMNEIKIQVKIDGKYKLLPIKILRKNLTRAEISGILGAFDKDHKFDIEYLKTPNFMNDIFEIQKGKKDELIIQISANDKFDWEELPK